MNERIGKLAVEAGAHWEHGDWNMPSAVYFSERELEKFAELIVHECMSCSIWVGKMNTNLVEPVHTAHAINQRIKQQFGVEE